MKYANRKHVEQAGFDGVKFDDDRARVLSSFWLYLDPQDEGFTPCAKRDGYWEAWITYWMTNNVEPGDVCIDIGANHGYYSMLLASCGCEVIAVEPQEHLCELIKRSAKANKFDVRVDRNVISDSNDPLQLVVPIHHGMNATVASQNSYAPYGDIKMMVPSLKLDNYCDGNKYSFIKIDAEGAEELIWSGGAEFRKQNPDCLYLMEWRWDRFENPERFGSLLLDTMNVTSVNYDGNEDPIKRIEELKIREHEDWMLALRRKSE